MKLNVLTLNTWGLWIISRHRQARTQQLARYLAKAKHLDVVVLQEVWVDQDAERVLRAGRQGDLQHGMHFKSGLFGSGLVTLSRFPIVAAGFQRYSASGDAMAIHCGDYYAGKGVGWVRLATPLGYVDVFNTHLHANYSHKTLSGNLALLPPATTAASAISKGGAAGGKAAVAAGPAGVSAAWAAPQVVLPAEVKVPQDRFAPYRVAQVCELAQMVRSVSGSGEPSALILAGDINAKPHFLEMALLRCLLPELVDSWTSVHGTSEQSEVAGFTCLTPNCSYRSTQQVPERIDYVLVAGLVPVAATLELDRTPAGHSYSDHVAVMATLAAPPWPGVPLQPPTLYQHAARLGISTGRFQWSLANAGAGAAPVGTPPGQGTADAGAAAAAQAVAAALSQLLTAALLMLSTGAKSKSRHAGKKLSRSCLAVLLAVSILTLMPVSEVLPAWHLVHVAPPALLALLTALLAVCGVVGVLMAQLADSVQARVLRQSHAQLQLLATALTEAGVLLQPPRPQESAPHAA